MWALNCRAGANFRHLGSVCWQPTALGGNNVGFKLQGSVLAGVVALPPPRGFSYPVPGTSVGGSCCSKDAILLVSLAMLASHVFFCGWVREHFQSGSGRSHPNDVVHPQDAHKSCTLCSCGCPRTKKSCVTPTAAPCHPKPKTSLYSPNPEPCAETAIAPGRHR